MIMIQVAMNHFFFSSVTENVDWYKQFNNLIASISLTQVNKTHCLVGECWIVPQ